MTADALQQNTYKGTYLIVFQNIFTRLLTFSCNIYITRISEDTLLGALQDFELMHSSLLFLSRESVRMALLRNSSSKDAKNRNQLIVNMSFLPLLAFVVLLPFLLFLSSASKATLSIPMSLYVFAAGIELLAEPFYIYCQSRLLYDTRVKVEAIGFIVQTTCTLIGCHFARNSTSGHVMRENGVFIYGFAHVAGSLALLVAYVRQVSLQLSRESNNGFLDYFTPKSVRHKTTDDHMYFDPYLLSIASNFILQTVIKYILTTADKIALVALGVAEDRKGQYKLVSDLGSLVARMIFLVRNLPFATFQDNNTNITFISP